MLHGIRLFLSIPFFQHGDHPGFRSDGCVITARYPAGIESTHSGTAYQDILYGFIEGMAHMQNTRYIGRRYNDGKWSSVVGIAVEILFCHPMCCTIWIQLLQVHNVWLIPSGASIFWTAKLVNHEKDGKKRVKKKVSTVQSGNFQL